MLKPISLLLLLSFCLSAQDSRPVTNQAVGNLVITGVPESEVIRIIQNAPRVNFDLRPASTDALLKIGVSEDIIKAMAAREAGSAPTISPSAIGTSRLKLSAASLRNENANKPRVFVGDANDSWSFTASKHFAQGSTHPQTVEMIKTLAENCPAVIVTNDPEKADYKVQFERESNKLVRRHNKFAVFNRSGDLVYAASTRELGNAVRGFCASLR